MRVLQVRLISFRSNQLCVITEAGYLILSNTLLNYKLYYDKKVSII